MKRQERFGFYVDESGNHSMSEWDLEDERRRYLGITGCIVSDERYRAEFELGVNQIKLDAFGTTDVVLHRDDLVKRRGPFAALSCEHARYEFDQSLFDFLSAQHYRIVTVVIDKKWHLRHYRERAKHPYHYCMEVLLERYCKFLRRRNAVGDVTVESRNRQENEALESAWDEFYQLGTAYASGHKIQPLLTSKKLKFKRKCDKTAGLEIADLIAYPCRFDTLVAHGALADFPESFGRNLMHYIRPKYDAKRDGTINGYGRVLLRGRRRAVAA